MRTAARTLAIFLLFGCPAVAQAGMPSIDLTDVSRLRLRSISFFLMLFLLSIFLVRLLWNHLQREFPALPGLTYGKATAVVVLWGLLFVLVLTMISGARELLTPGAWEKQGWTHRLAETPVPSPDPAQEEARKQKLEQLRFALWDYARLHSGQFPANPTVSGIPSERWQTTDSSGMRFIYAGDSSNHGGPLAYEPDVFGSWRYVLFRNGDIRRLDAVQLDRVLRGAKP